MGLPWWTMPGRMLRAETLPGDTPDEAVCARAETPGALRILSGTTYDPGSQAFRLHTAINQYTPHASVFTRLGDNNPHCRLRQLDMYRDRLLLEALMAEADVVITHMDYALLEVLGVLPATDATLVHFYHGSVPPEAQRIRRGTVLQFIDYRCRERDAELGAIQAVARYDHLLDAPDALFVGMGVDVPRLRALRARALAFDPRVPGVDRPVRVGHSPTARSLKGSDEWESVMYDLMLRGVWLEPVPIQGMMLGDAMAMKATCDLFFDSFFLGMQGSGLEAAAMGIPVIAGDPKCAREHVVHTGTAPWVMADHARALGEAIAWLAGDPDARATLGAAQSAWVARWHDYPAVAERLVAGVAQRNARVAARLAERERLVTPTAERPVKTPKRRKLEVH